MSFPTIDLLLSMQSLRSKIVKWRVLAILFFFLLIIFIFNNNIKSVNPAASNHWIARVTIDGVITEAEYRNSLLKDLRNNKHCAAVVINVNSPGGSVVGSEILYNDISYINETKPVVVLMGTIAASGGYLLSLAADRIFAHEGTLTGSIGVVINSLEFTGLFEKLGINPLVIKKPYLKAVPSPFEKFSEDGRKAIDGVISDIYQYFFSLVEKNRNISRDKLLKIADGRVYTARQALNFNLIDQIGNEQDVLSWLKEEKSINYPVRNFEIKSKSFFSHNILPKKITALFNKGSSSLELGLQALYVQ
ncbi:protease IV [Candidatus Xenohaliotis californiensis]|uniref:Protease IV n=1 Tax=Candidatus Xenohaliotis californiensis TaxID=84677 RepID=A0ABM9N7Y9_9RICK|nr:protease IV [Candidatus Xenohaliotis californiensis]